MISPNDIDNIGNFGDFGDFGNVAPPRTSIIQQDEQVRDAPPPTTDNDDKEYGMVDNGILPPTTTTVSNNINNNSSNTTNISKTAMAAKVTPPRRWLMDRIRGQSKFGNRERPWGPCCWVPPAVGWCPGFWEENQCCKFYGRVGGYSSEESRFWCMHMGFVANLLAFLLMAYSCFAMSQDYTLLSNASFGSITMTERDNKFEEEILLRIGLRAIALDNPYTGVDRAVVAFDTFCDVSEDGLQRYMNPENCSSCYDNSLNVCISAILAVVSFLPTFFTDILRMYSGYDVNCQKAFGTFFSLCTIGLALNVLWTWKFLCGDTFYKNEIYLNAQGDRVYPEDPSREYTIEYEYTWGWALMAMLVGATLKFVEVLAHFCITTPSITRVLKEQEIYEIIREENLVEDQASPTLVMDQESPNIVQDPESPL